MSDKQRREISKAEFELRLIEELRQELPVNTVIGTEQVPRNRGQNLRGLTIHREGEQVSPVIYLDECYRQFLNGGEIHGIAADILQVCGQCGAITTDIADVYEDWERIKCRIVRRVVSRKDNEVLLAETPFREFLDLAVIYYCVFESREGFEAGVLIRNPHMRLWGVSREELERMADINMPMLCPPAFYTMQEMMGELLGMEFPEVEEHAGLYVLTNAAKCYGAVYMTDPNVLKKAADRVGEDFYVLPSSLHECMVVPVSVNADEYAMQNMVEEINCTQVPPDEVLGNSVYLYEREAGRLRLAVSAEARHCE